MLPIGLCAELACIWEATARKPGNVTRFVDFADTTYLDFVVSAAAIAPVLEMAQQRKVGETILEAVRATRQVTAKNTNLGIILLLAPLAKAPPREDLRSGVVRILGDLDVADARAVYEAIRLADPSGLGSVPDQDIREEPTQSLREVMALAAKRDLVARQYASGFQEIFEVGVPALQAGLAQVGSLERGIIFCHLHWLANYPDSLIVRKRGQAEAEEASRRARQVLAAGWPTTPPSRALLAEFDAWLRAEGNSRNPGTSADLVTACLFATLREGTIQVPLPIPWTTDPHHG